MLNDWFTHGYAARARAIETNIYDGSRPIIIRLGDDAIFLRGRTRETVAVLSPRYHGLKAVCHLPIALYLELASTRGEPLVEDERQRLAQLAGSLLEVTLADREVRRILDVSQALIDEVLNTGHATPQVLRRLEEETRAPIRACILAAAREELTRLHEEVCRFTERFREGEWRDLLVVVCAAHQPRYRQSGKQYFKRLLNEHHGVEGQVLYGENCRSEGEALRLVTTHLLDRELASFFLDSPLDLQQDVLADAASQVVDELFSKR